MKNLFEPGQQIEAATHVDVAVKGALLCVASAGPDDFDEPCALALALLSAGGAIETAKQRNGFPVAGLFILCTTDPVR